VPDQPFEPKAGSAVLAGRAVPRIYRVAGRADVHEFILSSVEQSGCRVLFATSSKKVPVYVGLLEPSGRRVGMMIYPFRMTRRIIHNRPSDEVRGQLRYGSEESWHTDDHFVAFDAAGVDTTLLLGVYLEGNMFVGLDPTLYDPLPLGISVYAKDRQVDAVNEQSWTVWERTNRPGERRAAPRAAEGLETLVGFAPRRLLDYARFERGASDLGLDPPLRYTAATDASAESRLERATKNAIHSLESSFDLSAHAILDIIHTRMRLEVAVKGGVAEYHLEQKLRADPAIAAVDRLDKDSQPDFRIRLVDGRTALVECKNVSPEPYANGDFKVEVQKTRATRDDPAGRLYRPDQFDVVAACLYSPTRRWEFRFIRTAQLERHRTHVDRLAATHRVDERWYEVLLAALDADPFGVGAASHW
jgi:hypothetical protein